MVTFNYDIDFSDTCVYCNWNKSHNGNCDKNGYAPFDCKNCNSYKCKKDNIILNGK